MTRKSNVRVVGFPNRNYDKKWLDTLNDKELSETALADGDTAIYEDLRDFQDTVLNPHSIELMFHYWYFLND